MMDRDPREQRSGQRWAVWAIIAVVVWILVNVELDARQCEESGGKATLIGTSRVVCNSPHPKRTET